MTWWRVELGMLGGVLRAEPCQEPGGPGVTVVYVQAKNEEAAKHAAWKLHQRNLQRARRLAYKEQGLCRCGRELEGEHKHCDTCRARRLEYNKRMAARRAGQVVETPSKAAAFAERREDERSEVRRAVLLEVRQAWLKAPNIALFADWLRAELEKLGVTEDRAANG